MYTLLSVCVSPFLAPLFHFNGSFLLLVATRHAHLIRLYSFSQGKLCWLMNACLNKWQVHWFQYARCSSSLEKDTKYILLGHTWDITEWIWSQCSECIIHMVIFCLRKEWARDTHSHTHTESHYVLILFASVSPRACHFILLICSSPVGCMATLINRCTAHPHWLWWHFVISYSSLSLLLFAWPASRCLSFSPSLLHRISKESMWHAYYNERPTSGSSFLSSSLALAHADAFISTRDTRNETTANDLSSFTCLSLDGCSCFFARFASLSPPESLVKFAISHLPTDSICVTHLLWTVKKRELFFQQTLYTWITWLTVTCLFSSSLRVSSLRLFLWPLAHLFNPIKRLLMTKCMRVTFTQWLESLEYKVTSSLGTNNLQQFIISASRITMQ